ncbi:MFS transporter, partial [bacterium LRH843]|nr:MFS transporter [bacterium LRH843]
GVAGLVMVPLLWWKLPESTAFLAARSEQSTETAAPKTGMRGLFTGRFALVTIGVWAASFMGLLLVYGLNTWLPQLMADAGYEVSDS